jgi:hypothetical protein
MTSHHPQTFEEQPSEGGVARPPAATAWFLCMWALCHMACAACTTAIYHSCGMGVQQHQLTASGMGGCMALGGC